jgi:apolipoprotein N-acyltransferase
MKSLNLKNNIIFLLPVLSGILLALAFPPYNLGFLIFIALIPLFLFINLKQVSNKKALLGGMIAGFLFFGIFFNWFFGTAPFEWLGATTQKDVSLLFFLVTIIWFSQTIFLSLFIGVFSWTIKKISNLLPLLFKFLLIIPFLWILLEYLRAWGFGIFWLGKETFLGPHWTFGNFAYALHNYPIFIQIADIAGIYGISFLIILINSILFLLLTRCKKKAIIGLIILLILISLVWPGYGIYKLKDEEKGEQRQIALLQTNFLSGSEFNPYQKRDVFEKVLKLLQTQEAVQNNPDFIVSPEGLGVVSLTNDNNLTKHLLKDFYQPGQIFLENKKIIDENQKIKSRLFYYDLEKENPIAFHDKILLVPGGDYLPLTVKSFMSIYSFNIDFEKKLYKKGEKIEPANTPKGIIGGGVCSSILSPNINREMTKKGAEILIVVSSDAPFHGAKSLLAQNLAMSKLRAVENRRYFAQATNMGYSFLLSPKGKIILKSPELGNKILFSNIRLINEKSFYVKFGDLIIFIVFALVLIMLLLFHRKTFLDFLKK